MINSEDMEKHHDQQQQDDTPPSNSSKVNMAYFLPEARMAASRRRSCIIMKDDYTEQSETMYSHFMEEIKVEDLMMNQGPKGDARRRRSTVSRRSSSIEDDEKFNKICFYLPFDPTLGESVDANGNFIIDGAYDALDITKVHLGHVIDAQGNFLKKPFHMRFLSNDFGFNDMPAVNLSTSLNTMMI
uniref:Uncharacterized protein n=2 Tax=Guillardia theta TaxID=55529 RepID=A0A7S4PQH8_GUITH|mmetsp:Transcript_9374/g.31353  ORF Transcript_9374/g.31353 Transcript_9374/m.31353 type:complete len:186 (+) Transcript_9374:215-772(+)